MMGIYGRVLPPSLLRKKPCSPYHLILPQVNICVQLLHRAWISFLMKYLCVTCRRKKISHSSVLQAIFSLCQIGFVLENLDYFCFCLFVCFGARGKLSVFLSVFMRTYNSTYLYKKKSLVCVSESDGHMQTVHMHKGWDHGEDGMFIFIFQILF